ncbi:MAG: 2-oxoacid:acceptor oxidoreductase subunit alpha, partial [Porphyromonadaceae bacterium]|nr:2-oxoacid:acceptor oxidoreductase subunit alpha [Porphyromonadaceae bacterium]
LALKSEAIGLAVMAELPLVIIDVQRGGPSTGLPTKSEQTDLMQALYGRNGEAPIPVLAATTPDTCFLYAYWAAKIAVEHMTPVILLTDTFVANGSSAWRIPDLHELPTIEPNYVSKLPEGVAEGWRPYFRNPETKVRYWAVPGTPGFEHRLGGLEKNFTTSAISTDAANHALMVKTRQEKIDYISNEIPLLEVEGDQDADTLIVGWGGTYGHLYEASHKVREQGYKIAHAHFAFINPLPKNTEEVLRRYKKVIIAEQNTGMFARYLRGLIDNFVPHQYNEVTGQPFSLSHLVEEFIKLIEE